MLSRLVTFLSDEVVIVTAGRSIHLTYVAQCRCNDPPVHCLYCTPPEREELGWTGFILAVQELFLNCNQKISLECRSIQDFVRLATIACMGSAFQTTLLPSFLLFASGSKHSSELAIRLSGNKSSQPVAALPNRAVAALPNRAIASAWWVRWAHQKAKA